MCGIVGVAAARSIQCHDTLRARCDLLAHRGPDESGTWISPDGRVGFGHRRLAIIDLSSGGRQPMSDETGEIEIAFNGEIYNYRELREVLRRSGHRFRSESDTEVLVRAY